MAKRTKGVAVFQGGENTADGHAIHFREVNEMCENENAAGVFVAG